MRARFSRTLAAIFTLALAIGMSTAIFSAVLTAPIAGLDARLLLLGAVTCALILAAADATGALIERALVRQLLAAPGTPRRPLVRRWLILGSLVALVGGALGLPLALWGIDLMSAARLVSPALDVGGSLATDAVVLAWTAALALGAGLLSGLIPARPAPHE